MSLKFLDMGACEPGNDATSRNIGTQVSDIKAHCPNVKLVLKHMVPDVAFELEDSSNSSNSSASGSPTASSRHYDNGGVL